MEFISYNISEIIICFIINLWLVLYFIERLYFKLEVDRKYILLIVFILILNVYGLINIYYHLYINDNIYYFNNYFMYNEFLIFFKNFYEYYINFLFYNII